MSKKEIADQFAKDNGVMVWYCESCNTWGVECKYCRSPVCHYYKFCCLEMLILQDKLFGLIEQEDLKRFSEDDLKRLSQDLDS